MVSTTKPGFKGTQLLSLIPMLYAVVMKWKHVIAPTTLFVLFSTFYLAYNMPKDKIQIPKSISEIPQRQIFISEQELDHDVYSDKRLSFASALHSRFSIVDQKPVYIIGDMLTVRIQLFNGYDKPVVRGGDLVRMWIKEPKVRACAAGHVTDNNNGTYTGIVEALWAGRPEVVVAIAGSRQSIKIIFSVLKYHKTLKVIHGIFEVNHITNDVVETPCLPYPEIRGYSTVCNFTAENYGLPWYCGEPASKDITCFDWKFNTVHNNSGDLPLTHKEQLILHKSNVHRHLPKTPTITVVGPNGAKRDIIRNHLLPACNARAPIESWLDTTPVGFFYRWRWFSTKCKQTINIISDYHRCLRGRRLHVFGDSTTRQWFVYLRKLLQLTMATQMFEDGQPWHKPCLAINDLNNYSVFWGPHELPFYGGENRGFNRPTYVYLDELPNDSRDIVVIHYYLHFVSFHPEVFTTHMLKLYQSVSSLLSRAPNVTVAIKGPHAFNDISNRVDDYWGPVYDNIIRTIFKPVVDRIHYLDYWDMSVSSEVTSFHPNDTIVASMVNYMLSVTCRNVPEKPIIPSD